jgi:hypothetical protein
MELYYVYHLIDLDGKTFYVGMGKRRRMYNHVYKVNRGIIPNGNQHLYNKIKKILEIGDVTYKKVFESYNRDEVIQREIADIAEIGIDNLCNKTPGGDVGFCSGTHTLETRKKISDALKTKHPFRGKPLNEVHKKNISNALTGKTLSDEHKKNIGQSRYYPLGKDNPTTKKYIIKSPTGELYTLYTKKDVKYFILEQNKKILGDKFIDGKPDDRRIGWKRILYGSGESKGWVLIKKELV